MHVEIDRVSQLLRDAGFTSVTVVGDYRPGAEPAPNSRTWTFEAVRG